MSALPKIEKSTWAVASVAWAQRGISHLGVNHLISNSNAETLWSKITYAYKQLFMGISSKSVQTSEKVIENFLNCKCNCQMVNSLRLFSRKFNWYKPSSTTLLYSSRYSYVVFFLRWRINIVVSVLIILVSRNRSIEVDTYQFQMLNLPILA